MVAEIFGIAIFERRDEKINNFELFKNTKNYITSNKLSIKGSLGQNILPVASPTILFGGSRWEKYLLEIDLVPASMRYTQSDQKAGLS